MSRYHVTVMLSDEYTIEAESVEAAKAAALTSQCTRPSDAVKCSRVHLTRVCPEDGPGQDPFILTFD